MISKSITALAGCLLVLSKVKSRYWETNVMVLGTISTCSARKNLPFYLVFWAKTGFVLDQNDLCFGPKCIPFWAKTFFSNYAKGVRKSVGSDISTAQFVSDTVRLTDIVVGSQQSTKKIRTEQARVDLSSPQLLLSGAQDYLRRPRAFTIAR